MGHIRVDPPNTNNKWVGFGLANVDTFIIRVGFGLVNVDMIHTLTRHEHDPLTRIATPTLCHVAMLALNIAMSQCREVEGPQKNQASVTS